MSDSLNMYDDFSNVVSNEEIISTESVLDILKENAGTISVFDLMAVNAEMIEDIKLFDLASNFYWGAWALIQAALSNIDFNYNEYANLRFKRYFVIKNRLLGKSK